MSLSRDLGFQTTVEMRASIRKLASGGATDDYDRAVLMLLDDFARAMVLIASLSEASRAKAARA